MMLRRTTLRLVTLAAIGTPAIAEPPPFGHADLRDTIHLKSGRKIRGRVVLELDQKVALQVGTRERWIPTAKIARIESVARNQRSLLDQFEKAGDSVASFRKLAQFCAARLRTVAELEKLHSDWGKARELRSEHFQLRTDTGLRRAIFTLLELEFFYRRMVDLFQVDLELRELTEPVKAYVYKSRKQFPSLSNTTSAYFAPNENILYTFAALRGRPVALFHEATHAILFNLTGGARGVLEVSAGGGSG